MSSKVSNVMGVIFDLFFMIKTRPVSGGNVGVGSGWGMRAENPIQKFCAVAGRSGAHTTNQPHRIRHNH